MSTPTTNPLKTETTTAKPTNSDNDPKLHGLCHLSAVLSRGATMKPNFFIRYYNKYFNLVKNNFKDNNNNKIIYIPAINNSNKDKYKEIFEKMYKYPFSMLTGREKTNDEKNEDIINLKQDINGDKLICHTFRYENTKCYLIIDTRIKKIFICYSSVVWQKTAKMEKYPKEWQQAKGESDNTFPWFTKIIELLHLTVGHFKDVPLPDVGIITSNMIDLIINSTYRDYDIICTGHGIAGCLAEITALLLKGLSSNEKKQLAFAPDKQRAIPNKNIIVANWSTPAWLPKKESHRNQLQLPGVIDEVEFYKFTTHGDLYPEMPRVCDPNAKNKELTYKLACTNFSNPSGYVRDITTYDHIGVEDNAVTEPGIRTLNPNNYLVYSVGFDKIDTLVTKNLIDNFIIPNDKINSERSYSNYNDPLKKNGRDSMAGFRLGFIYGKIINNDSDGNNWWYNNKPGKLDAEKILTGGRRKTRKRRKRKGGRRKTRKNKRKTRRKSKKRRRRTRRRKRR